MGDRSEGREMAVKEGTGELRKGEGSAGKERVVKEGSGE